MKRTLSLVAGSFALGAAIVAGASAPIFPAAQASAQDAETVIASGSWDKVSFKSSGTWSVVESGGSYFVELSSDFKTRNAPDLKIFLSPQSAGSLTGRNATDGAVLVSELSSNRGGQRYEIPAGVDVSDYTSIAIHCEQYSKLWSVSDL